MKTLLFTLSLTWLSIYLDFITNGLLLGRFLLFVDPKRMFLGNIYTKKIAIS
jgi:hypothetical protein